MPTAISSSNVAFRTYGEPRRLTDASAVTAAHYFAAMTTLISPSNSLMLLLLRGWWRTLSYSQVKNHKCGNSRVNTSWEKLYNREQKSCLPWFTQSSSAMPTVHYSLRYNLQQRIMTTDMAKPWQHLQVLVIYPSLSLSTFQVLHRRTCKVHEEIVTLLVLC